MRYKDIYIERYNNGERNFSRERTVFDYYETQELMGEDKANKVAFEYYKEAFGEAKAKQIVRNHYTDITRVAFDLDNLAPKIKIFADELIEQATTVGGDDDSFDYFPDLVFAFKQICEAVGYNETYKEIVSILNKQLEYEPDDELFIE
jgi:hypothetical protein